MSGNRIADRHKDGGLQVIPETLLTDAVNRAEAALSRSQIYVLRKLQVEADGEAVVLRGRVDSFYHKQLAQELVRMAVEGVEVLNLLHVEYRSPMTDSSIQW